MKNEDLPEGYLEARVPSEDSTNLDLSCERSTSASHVEALNGAGENRVTNQPLSGFQWNHLLGQNGRIGRIVQLL